jgi:hypothetical protein
MSCESSLDHFQEMNTEVFDRTQTECGWRARCRDKSGGEQVPRTIQMLNLTFRDIGFGKKILILGMNSIGILYLAEIKQRMLTKRPFVARLILANNIASLPFNQSIVQFYPSIKINS